MVMGLLKRAFKEKEPVRQTGIPYDRIKNQILSGVNTGIVVGNSGRKMEYKYESSEIPTITIKDIELIKVNDFEKCIYPDGKTSYGYMSAKVSIDNAVWFSIWTKKTKHHPDMYGNEFVKFALDLFAAKGVTVLVCMGEWYSKHSDNYTQFMNVYRFSKDKMKAVNATWTANIFQRYGFICQNENDIQMNGVNSTNTGPSSIYVTFKKIK